MARDIATIKQTNLWGKAADNGLGLEPQRTDLFIVDFTVASKGIALAVNQTLPEMFPQFVRGVTLPDQKLRAEPIRRDSVPYQMPSWDEPLDPVKITFVLDTHSEDDKSNVINFLDAWLALTRAGRGSRVQGYANSGWLTLDMNYRVAYAYNVHLYLLRGASFAVDPALSAAVTDQELNRYLANANTIYRNMRKQQGLIQTGENFPQQTDVSQAQFLARLAQEHPQTSANAAVEQDMVIHSIYVLYNAWLGGYKLSDFSYTDSGIATVDATFYVEAVRLDKVPLIQGQASPGMT